MLMLSLYDDALMIPLVFIALLKEQRMKRSCIDQQSNLYHHLDEQELK